MATFDYSETSHDIYKYTLKKDGKSKGYVLFYVFYIDNTFSDPSHLYIVKDIDTNIENSFFYQQTWDDLSKKFVDHFVPSTEYDDNYIKTEYEAPSSNNYYQPFYKIVINGDYGPFGENVAEFGFYESNNYEAAKDISEQFLTGIYFVLYNTDKKQVVDLQGYSNSIASFKFSVSGRPIPYKINSFISDDKCGNLEIIGSIDEIHLRTNKKHYNVFNTVEKILGVSKKYDPTDPDPNIDDSDGDKNRTPTDEIGGNTISDDDLPTISVMDTGLVTLYNPTVGELSSLGRFLWSDAFSVDTFKKLFSDPFDTLLGLSILPVTPKISGRHDIYFGNIDSGVSCNVVANQFLKVDMGTLTLNETYASAFDYAPSTQVDIYLPFIGSHGLNTNDVMGSTIHLIYKFDLLSGGCIAELFINHTSQGNKTKGLKYNPNMGLAYTFTGQCSCSIPLTSNNYNGMIHSIIQSIGTVGAIGASVATGNPALGIASVATSAATIGLQANTPTVQRSGSIGSSNALLSCLTPYLSVQRAHVCKPGHFYSKRGIPSQVYVDKISSVGSGNYFQIADCVDLHASGASDTELSEIKSILTSGAIW